MTEGIIIQADPESLPEWAPFSAHLLAGALAGIAEHTLTYPLDLVKTRLQVHLPTSITASSTSYYSYTGLLNALHRITFVETAGPRQFIRGVQSVILGAGPAHAVYFASYEACKKLLKSDERKNNTLIHSASGAVATTLADALMTPFDVIKQRLQLQNSMYKGVVDCFKKVAAREGLWAFYISYPTTLLLNIPFHGIQFPVYEAVRSFLVSRHHHHHHQKHIHQHNINDVRIEMYNPMDHIGAGGVAGAIAAFFTTPLDVLKTTLQTKGEFLHLAQSNENIACSRPPLRGMMDAGRWVYNTHGIKGFWRGALPRCLTFMPSTAICWGVYEYFKHYLLFNTVTSSGSL